MIHRRANSQEETSIYRIVLTNSMGYGRGFTLIEVLVSIALGAMVALSGTYILVEATLTNQTAQLNVEETQLVKTIENVTIKNVARQGECLNRLLFPTPGPSEPPQLNGYTGQPDARVRVWVPIASIGEVGHASGMNSSTQQNLLNLKASVEDLYFTNWVRLSQDVNGRDIMKAELFIKFNDFLRSGKNRGTQLSHLIGTQTLVIDQGSSPPRFIGCQIGIPDNDISDVSCRRRGLRFDERRRICTSELASVENQSTACGAGYAFTGINQNKEEICRTVNTRCPAGQYLVSINNGFPVCSTQQNPSVNSPHSATQSECEQSYLRSRSECLAICQTQVTNPPTSLEDSNEDYDYCAEVVCVRKPYQACNPTELSTIPYESAPLTTRVNVGDTNQCLCSSTWIDSGSCCNTCYVRTSFDVNLNRVVNERRLRTASCASGSIQAQTDRTLTLDELVNNPCDGIPAPGECANE